MSTAAVRQAVTIRRDLEFFSEPELAKQLGYSKPHWPLVLVAELIDNALDHLEEIKRPPCITIATSDDGITVTDNGQGMPEAVIAGLLDFSSRTSSRVCYRSPTRGSQGNAGKCLVALPYVWSGGTAGRVEITVGNRKHVITAMVDSLTRAPVVDRQIVQIDDIGNDNEARSADSEKPAIVQFPRMHESDGSRLIDGQNVENVQVGTTVYVELPGLTEDHRRLISGLMLRYSILNPHAAFVVNASRWEPLNPSFKKWSAAKPDPIDWYTYDAFRERVATAADEDRRGGAHRTAREFISQFAGFRRTDVCSATLSATGLTRVSLLDIATDAVRLRRLFDVMRHHSEPPKPSDLGVIGRQALKDAIGTDGFRYRKVEGMTCDGLPFVIEAAFVKRAKGGRFLISGINFSPDVLLPAMRCVPELLQEYRVEEDHACTVVVHLATPAPAFTNRGKTELTLGPIIETAIEQVIQHVCADHFKSIKAIERDAARFDKSLSRAASSASVSLKDAIYHYLPDSIKHMSGGGKYPFDARSHYYYMRPLVQKMAGRQLTQKRLDAVIDEWEALHGIIELRHRDARGFLLQPHDGRRIPLGTRSVNAYGIPEFLFHNLLFIEKKGLLSILEAHDIPDRYDLAIVAAEGFSTRAAQMLMQEAAKGHRMKVVVLHDADPAGYMIADALGRRSGAHQFDYDVYDAGLSLDEALEMGLETEEFIRTQALTEEIEWTEAEREYFGGEPTKYTTHNGGEGTKWTARRVELNALAADPPRFIAWVEQKLREAGVASRLVPPADVIADYATEYYLTGLESMTEASVQELINMQTIIEAVRDQLPWARIDIPMDGWARATRPEGWRAPVEIVVDRFLNHRRSQVETIVRANLD